MVDIPQIPLPGAQTKLSDFNTPTPAPVAVQVPTVAAPPQPKKLWVDNYPPEFHEHLKTMKNYPKILHTKSFAPNYNLWNQFVSQHDEPLRMIAEKRAMDEGEPEPEPEPEPNTTHEDRVREMMGL